MGLVVLLFTLLYVVLLVAATVLGYRYGRKRGWTPRKRRWAAAVGFLIIFLPMFWDGLPTIWLHSYYCEKYGGFTVYKTPEQWKKENRGIAETLVRPKTVQQVNTANGRYFQLNQRIRWEIQWEQMPLWLRQQNERLVDINTGEVLAQYVDFSTGQASGRLEGAKELRDIKAWMYRDSCEPEGKGTNRRRFSEIKAAFDPGRDKK